jgi:amidase
LTTAPREPAAVAAPAPASAPAPAPVRRVTKDELLYTYAPGRAPVATVASGERLLIETRTAFGEAELLAGREVVGPPPGRADPLTGPIFVSGAEVGDALAVHIERIELIGDPVIGPIRGVSALDWGPLPVDVLEVRDGKLLVGRLELPLRPMVGCIAVAPPFETTPSTSVGDHGGNLDTKHIGMGATVLLPVFEPGAGLVLGDCHALQGDGEITGAPPETDAEVTIRVEVIKDRPLQRPRVLTAERYMTIASAATLERACALAVADMIGALASETSLTPDEAYVLLTLCGDLEVSQIVNSSATVRVAVDRGLLDV